MMQSPTQRFSCRRQSEDERPPDEGIIIAETETDKPLKMHINRDETGVIHRALWIHFGPLSPFELNL